MEIKIVSSADGSHTLLIPELNETYHSTKGALTESEYVFIQEGIEYQTGHGKNDLAILEVGFGTGLNAVLTWRAAEHKKTKLFYTTLEPFPVPFEILDKMNYPELLGEFGEKFRQLHLLDWQEKIQLSPFFTFEKYQTKLEDFGNDSLFDIIYFDAFAPSKQPEIWSGELMKKCYKMLREGGVLVTYCAQGQFKRDLRAAGFQVETLPGPPGKKEMTRGLK